MQHIWLSSVTVIALTACATSLQPITDIEAGDAAVSLQAEISGSQQSFTQSITLYEAMARALKYNLDHRVSMMEIDVARADYKLSRHDLLPDVVVKSRSYSRNKEAGTSGLSLISGRESLEPSTGTERSFRASDLTTTWNVLDFGLSKLRSEQLADEALIYEERRRKAVSQILGDVQNAYWRALCAQRFIQSLTGLEADIQRALDDSHALYAARNTSPMTALSYQRDLNAIQADAGRLARDISIAKTELAGLMGLAPNQSFSLEQISDDHGPRALVMDYEAMIDLALRQRPEVREAIYANRIGKKEMKKVVLETLPSLEAFAGLNVSSNDFLYHSNWADYGARANWNLMQFFTLGPRKRKAKAQSYLEEQRLLATAIAVMTQIGIARTLYESSIADYLTAERGAEIQTDILMQVEALSKAGVASRQSVIRERLSSLISEARRDLLQAEMKQAAAHIYASMGADPYGADIQGDEDVATLAVSLQAYWEARENAPKI